MYVRKGSQPSAFPGHTESDRSGWVPALLGDFKEVTPRASVSLWAQWEEQQLQGVLETRLSVCRAHAGTRLTVTAHPVGGAEWPQMAHDFRLEKNL